MGAGSSRDDDPLWCEAMPNNWSWAFLWNGYIRCMCGGIRTIDLEAQCGACGKAWVEPAPLVIRDTDSHELHVQPDFAGAEGRYEDWVYLSMLEREWRRPVDADLYGSIPENSRPSARAIVVLVFWSYFETRIGRLFRETAKAVPGQVMDHLLELDLEVRMASPHVVYPCRLQHQTRRSTCLGTRPLMRSIGARRIDMKVISRMKSGT